MILLCCVFVTLCLSCLCLCSFVCMESISWPIFKLGHENISRRARNVTQRIANQITQDINFNRHTDWSSAKCNPMIK